MVVFAGVVKLEGRRWCGDCRDSEIGGLMVPEIMQQRQN